MAAGIALGRRTTVTLVVAVGMGLVVGLLAALVSFATDGGSFQLDPMTVVHGGLAALAGGVLAAFFGRGGVLGWIVALVLGAAITAAASFVAPILGPSPDLSSAQAALDALPSDLSQVSLDTFQLPLALVASPFLGLLWVALVSAVHAAAGGARQS